MWYSINMEEVVKTIILKRRVKGNNESKVSTLMQSSKMSI